MQAKFISLITVGLRIEIIAETAAQKRRTLPTQGCSSVTDRFIFNLILAEKKSVNG